MRGSGGSVGLDAQGQANKCQVQFRHGQFVVVLSSGQQAFGEAAAASQVRVPEGRDRR